MPGLSYENWTTQLRKGLLELAILNALGGGPLYGYEIVRTNGQSMVVPGQASAHWPSVHALPAAHVVPHAPQWRLSVCRSTQALALPSVVHAVRPVGQLSMQTPSMHH